MAMQNLSLASIIQESKAGENDAVRAFAPVGSAAPEVDLPQYQQRQKPTESNSGINAVKGIEENIKSSEEEATKRSKGKNDMYEGASNTDYLQTFLKMFEIS